MTGTDGDDRIHIENGDNGKLIIRMNAEYFELDPQDINKLEVLAGAGDDRVTVGEGVDLEQLKIDLGMGNDTVTNYADGIEVFGGSGKDTLNNYANDVTFEGGAGADHVLSQGGDRLTFHGGQGGDHVDVSGGEGHTIQTGEDDDQVQLEANNSTVETGAGMDTINVDGENVIVDDGGDYDQITENGVQRLDTDAISIPEGLDIRDLLMFILVVVMKHMREQLNDKRQEIQDAVNGDGTDKDIDVLTAELDDLVSDRNNLFDMLTASINMLQQTASAVSKMRNG